MKINSLSFRLLVSAGFVLMAFFALVAVVLEQGFRESAEQALKEKLQVHVYSLLSVAELKATGHLAMPETLKEPRFSNPGSGLYAFIHQPGQHLVWRSLSAVGVDIAVVKPLKAGQPVFIKEPEGRFVLSYAIIWENVSGLEQSYVFTVAEDALFISHQVERFRLTLWSWLSFTGFLLVLVQFVVLRWSLKPLRSIVRDLEAIEAGDKNQLNGQYPSELTGLAGNLNALVNSERAHLERYRNTLADLAHSLKTPLAILRGCVQSDEVNKSLVNAQISRMDEIVEYQLQKAAAKGRNKLVNKVDVSLIVEKIITSLHKVYADKEIIFSMQLDRHCLMYCEEGDVYEIAGNLLDNAAKWCNKKVNVTLLIQEKKQGMPFSLLLQIEDDGSGIPASKLKAILQRGIRADESIQGHGIGMAVVNELTSLLGGQLVAGRSDTLGGMKWQVYF